MIRYPLLLITLICGTLIVSVPQSAKGQITNSTYAGPTTPPDNNWGLFTHWNPPVLPGPTNNVVHDIGGQLRYDVTNAGNQTIYSMEVEGGDDAELTVESALDLNILSYLARDVLTDPYLLRLTESSEVTIGSNNANDGVFDLDVIIEQGTAQVPTSLTVDGDIEYGAWVTDPDTTLTVSHDIFRGQWTVLGGTIEAEDIEATDAHTRPH